MPGEMANRDVQLFGSGVASPKGCVSAFVALSSMGGPASHLIADMSSETSV